MTHNEALQYVRDHIEEYKAQQRPYPATIYIEDDIWQALKTKPDTIHVMIPFKSWEGCLGFIQVMPCKERAMG
jgi:hypothetical protein